MQGVSIWGAFWKGQHANPAKRERRQLLKAIGRRQLLKRMKADRRRQKPEIDFWIASNF